MSKVIKLNRARKDRLRAQKRAQADENALRFGRSKAQKAREEQQSARARALLDGHRREDEA